MVGHIRRLVEVVAPEEAIGGGEHSVVGRVIMPAVQHVQLVEAVVPLWED